MKRIYNDSQPTVCLVAVGRDHYGTFGSSMRCRIPPQLGCESVGRGVTDESLVTQDQFSEGLRNVPGAVECRLDRSGRVAQLS